MTHDEDVGEDEHLQDIEELKNLEIQLDGGVIGKDFREIILRQMKLNHALSERQHQDIAKMHNSVKEFVASSKRVEKLTFALIGLTGILAAMTFLLIPR